MLKSKAISVPQRRVSVNRVYLIDDSLLAKAKSELEGVFKSVGVFKVELNDSDKKHLEPGNEKELFIRLINEFEAFAKDYEACIVLGCGGFRAYEPLALNLKIAKNLNTPIYDANAADIKVVNKNSKLLISADMSEIVKANQEIMTPARFENSLLAKALASGASVVLPESEDPRVLKATAILLEKGLSITLLGDKPWFLSLMTIVSNANLAPMYVR